VRSSDARAGNLRVLMVGAASGALGVVIRKHQ
jgi:hypothetical protein